MEYGAAIIVVVFAVLAILRGMGRLPRVRGQAARRLVISATVLSASAVVAIAFLAYSLTR